MTGPPLDVELTDDQRARIRDREVRMGRLAEEIRDVYREALLDSGVAPEWIATHY